MSNYEQDAARTMSDKFYGDLVSFKALAFIMSRAVTVSEGMDMVKKALFYGKVNVMLDDPDSKAPSVPDFSSIHPKFNDILHCAIGAFTEAGEQINALMKAIETGQLDTVNMCEEVGDTQWYSANMANALGTTLEKIQEANIAKLRKRFPDKFTEDQANNRDLFEERQTLEQHHQ